MTTNNTTKEIELVALNNMFYERYHKYYPENVESLQEFIEFYTQDIDSKHVQAINHFLNVLQEKESGFVYGMLCNAWQKLLEDLG